MPVCLFDIDGTLIASGGAGKAALEAGLSSEFGVNRLIEKLDLSGRTDRAIVTDLLRRLDLPTEEATQQRLFNAYLRHLPDCLRRSTGRVLPGIQPLLNHLRERTDVALGLLTGNIRAGARVKLEHFGLHEYFTFGGFGDEYHDRDDVARSAWRELTALYPGVSPREVWVIGDTPLDIRCARAIGARVVAVATGWHPPEELSAHAPDLIMADLADPQQWFRHW